MTNILITCAGRQVYLIEAFRNDLRGRGKVFASDISSTAPSLKVADKGLISPSFSDDGYLDWLLDICNKYKIKLIITLNVDDLFVLEKSRNIIETTGCQLVGGPLESISVTNDKLHLHQFCDTFGLRSPDTFLLSDYQIESRMSYPLIIKPRHGRGSKGNILINNDKDFDTSINMIFKKRNESYYILQEYLLGEEYGFDIVNDLKAKYIGTLARKKYRMKNGETYIAETISSNEFNSIGERVSNALKHQGLVDVDVIMHKGFPYLIDINFRFGGGYIFNHYSGANIPKAYLMWSLGQESTEKYLNYEVGKVFKRNNSKLKEINPVS